MEQYSHNRYVTAVILGLMLFVIALSAIFFSHQSLRLDESQSLWQTSHSPTKIFNLIAQDVHVPLYHLILHFWQLFLSNSVFIGRMLSLLFFVASIPAIYFLGKRTASAGVGLFAAVLLSISPFMNWYGNEIRMYSLMTFLAIMSQYLFVLIYKYKSRDAWIGYFFVSLLGIFTHYFFFFILLVQAIFFLAYRRLFPPRSLSRFLTIGIVLVLAVTPWIIYVRSIDTVSNSAPLLIPPTSVNVFNAFSQFLFGFQNDHLNTILVSLWPLTVLLGFLALRENKKVTPEVVYLLMSIIIPIVAAFVVSVTIRPLFVSRYLIITIPALYIVISWIFSTYPPKLQKTFGAILIFAMLVGLGIEAINPSTPVKEDYREAAAYLNATTTPRDIVIVSAPFTIYPVEYYYTGQSDIATIPIWNRYVSGPIPAFNEDRLPQDIETLKASHEKAWLLLSYDQGYEDAVRMYMDKNFERIDMKVFSPHLTLYAYRLRYDPHVLP